MSNFEIIINDELINLLRDYADNMHMIPSGVDNTYHFKLSGLNPNVVQNIASLNGRTVRHHGMSVNSNGLAYITKYDNFNADQYYNQARSNDAQEKETLSIYEIQRDPSQFNLSFNPFKDPGSAMLYSNIAFSNISVTPGINAIQPYKSLFPTYLDIDTTSQPENKLFQTLNDMFLYEGFIDAIISAEFDETNYVTTMGDMQIKSISVSDLLEKIKPMPDDYQLQAFHSEDVMSPVYGQLEYSLMLNMVEKLADNYCRQPSQIINNESVTHKEVFCYKIQKFKEGENFSIQTFYVPASNSYSGFTDTQILYGNTYTYQITAIYAAYVPLYEYRVEADVSSVMVTVVVTNDIRLFEIPAETENVNIQAAAPTRPEVAFLNESNNNKKMRFYFEPGHHEHAEKFVPIAISDIEPQSKAQTNTEGDLVFNRGQGIITYEIYKLNQRPNSYLDFADALYADVSNVTPSPSEVFETFLTPNRKFYFTFRSRNEFGLYSNPTPVYELELIQDSDETRVVAKTIKFERENKQRTRTFGRFLRLYPSFEQVLIREFKDQILEGGQLKNSLSDGIPSLESDIEDPPFYLFDNKQYYLGTSDSPIWGRKFKIRVKSNETGKVADINIDFVLNKVKSEEDFT